MDDGPELADGPLGLGVSAPSHPRPQGRDRQLQVAGGLRQAIGRQASQIVLFGVSPGFRIHVEHYLAEMGGFNE
jgi:hypothetical protein